MAKRVNFSADFIYTPKAERRVATKYRAGMKAILVTDECADKAIELGRAVLTPGRQPGSRRRARVPSS